MNIVVEMEPIAAKRCCRDGNRAMVKNKYAMSRDWFHVAIIGALSTIRTMRSAHAHMT